MKKVRRKTMDYGVILNFISDMLWPIVVLVIIFVFRSPIKDFIDRIREFEGPGDIKASLDTSKVTEILEKGKSQKKSSQELAQEIVKISRDKREKRILRALLDDKGRAIYNYQRPYYRHALESLLDEGLVERLDKGYGLTDQGFRVTKEYLENILKEDANS